MLKKKLSFHHYFCKIFQKIKAFIMLKHDVSIEKIINQINEGLGKRQSLNKFFSWAEEVLTLCSALGEGEGKEFLVSIDKALNALKLFREETMVLYWWLKREGVIEINTVQQIVGNQHYDAIITYTNRDTDKVEATRPYNGYYEFKRGLQMDKYGQAFVGGGGCSEVTGTMHKGYKVGDPKLEILDLDASVPKEVYHECLEAIKKTLRKKLANKNYEDVILLIGYDGMIFSLIDDEVEVLINSIKNVIEEDPPKKNIKEITLVQTNPDFYRPNNRIFLKTIE